MRQIAPTRSLLTKLDIKHPGILRAEGIVPADYHGSIVFRSAAEKILVLKKRDSTHAADRELTAVADTPKRRSGG